MATRRAFLIALAIGASACSLRNVACGAPAPPPTQAGAPAAAAPPASADPADAPKVKIAFLGDSLTAGFGLLSQQAYPFIVQNLFAGEGYHEIEAVNAGMTGDTSAGGLRRVEQLLEPDVKVLVVALGGNDALRGLTAEQTHANLSAIIKTAQAKGLAVMLCGMQAPTNLGEDYQTAFRAVYLRLLREHQGTITFVPFLLEGVAANPAMNQPDGIHPNDAGARVIAEALYPKLRDLVDQVIHSGGGGG